MRKIILFSILLLLIPNVVFAGAPSRPHTYISGQIVDPDENNANENTIFNYLAGGVDTYKAGSVNAAAIGANAVGNSEINNSAAFTFSGTNTHSGTSTFSGTANVTGTLQIDGTTVTSSATELNLLTGETGDILTSGDAAGGDLTGTYPNPTIAANKIPKVIFTWSGVDEYTAVTAGIYAGTTASAAAADVTGYLYALVEGSTYKTILKFRFKKVAGITTIRIEARLWSSDASASREALLRVNVGARTAVVKSVTSTTPTWVTAADIDVSGLTDGTIYDGIVELANEDAYIGYCSAVTLIGS